MSLCQFLNFAAGDGKASALPDMKSTPHGCAVQSSEQSPEDVLDNCQSSSLPSATPGHANFRVRSSYHKPSAQGTLIVCGLQSEEPVESPFFFHHRTRLLYSPRYANKSTAAQAQNLALTAPFSSSPTMPFPANVHFSLTNPSVTVFLSMPLCA